MFDRFRSLSIQRQIALVAGAVGALSVVFLAVWFLALRVTYEPLFTELRTTDAATIVAGLERKKIPYHLADGGTTILVPSDSVDATRLSVMTEDLPLKGTVGFELFSKSDMGQTDFAQKINYQRALQGELERTIMTLDGIASARVHLSLGEDRIFRDDRVPPKASVTIRMLKNATLPPRAAEGIQRLVAAAVPNLELSDVVLLDEKGDVLGAPAHLVPVPGTDSPVQEERRAIEQYYAALVRQALQRAFPQSRFKVLVTANPGAPEGAALLDWNPAARAFPLEIDLASDMALDAASQRTLRGLVENAIQSDPSRNDIVSLSVIAAAPAAPEEERASAPVLRAPVQVPPPAVAEDTRSSWQLALLLAAAMVLVLTAFLVLILRLRRPKRLSPAQRVEFATKLRAALDKGGSNVVSR